MTGPGVRLDMVDHDHRWVKHLKYVPGAFMLRSIDSPKMDKVFIQRFVASHSLSVQIPCFLNRVRIATIYRSLMTKDFVVDSKVKAVLYVPEMADWGDLRFGMPIVLTEGVLDAYAARRHHNYVAAVLGSVVTAPQAVFLACITDKVVLAFDSDPSGIGGSVQSRAKLEKLGVRAIPLKSVYGLDDPGQLLDDNSKGSEFRLSMDMALDALKYG